MERKLTVPIKIVLKLFKAVVLHHDVIKKFHSGLRHFNRHRRPSNIRLFIRVAASDYRDYTLDLAPKLLHINVLAAPALKYRYMVLLLSVNLVQDLVVMVYVY